VHLGIFVWIYLVFVDFDLVKIYNVQLVSHVTQKYLTYRHETLEECCTACVVVHLGILVWTY
jgi:hypothetical protein